MAQSHLRKKTCVVKMCAVACCGSNTPLSLLAGHRGGLQRSLEYKNPHPHRDLQGCLAHKKQRPPRILQWDYT